MKRYTRWKIRVSVVGAMLISSALLCSETMGTRPETIWTAVPRYYKAGEVAKARALINGSLPTMGRRAILLLSQPKPPLAEVRRFVQAISGLTTTAIREEQKAAKPKGLPPEAMRLLSNGVKVVSDVWDHMQKLKLTTAEDRFFRRQTSMDLAKLVRLKIQILQSSGHKEESAKLATRYSNLLSMEKPRPVIGTKHFIESVHARPGPLQIVNACYRHEMPVAARVRFLELLQEYRRRAMDQAAKKPVAVRAPEAIKEMVRLTLDVVGGKEDSLANMSLLNMSVEIIGDTLGELGMVQTESKDYAEAVAAARVSMQQLRAFQGRHIARSAVLAKKIKTKAVEGLPQSGGGVDWSRALRITGGNLQVCTMIGKFYQAMADGDALAMDKVLAKGPDYASGKEIVEYLQRQKEAGRFDKLLGYKVVRATQFRFARVQGGAKVLVHSLEARFVMQGKEVIRTNSGIFDLVRTSAGIRLGYSKRKVQGKVGRVSPQTRPATTQSATTTIPTTLPQDNRRIRK